MLKNPSWLFTSVAGELNSGLPSNNSRKRSELDLNPGPPHFKSGALTTRLRCLAIVILEVRTVSELLSTFTKYCEKYVKDIVEDMHVELGLKGLMSPQTSKHCLLNAFVCGYTKHFLIPRQNMFQILSRTILFPRLCTQETLLVDNVSVAIIGCSRTFSARLTINRFKNHEQVLLRVLL